ncbi:MAG: STAS domain-containing protein [Myxococcales bacterium]|nr:STAS domain-containing protein [Myxococcales bacterium]
MTTASPELMPALRERVATIAIEGEVGARELSEVFEMLFRTVNRGVTRVVLDLGGVAHFHYRGVRPLLARAEVMRRAGGDIKLAGLSPYLHAIFRSAGAHQAFEYYAATEEARAAFGPAAFG